MADDLHLTGIRLDTTPLRRGRSKAEREFRKLENRADKLESEVEGATGSFSRMGRVVTGVAAALGGMQIGRFIFRTNVEFQKLETQLTSVTGSAEAAEEAFSLITDFATETPFEVQNLTRAFTDLQLRGLEPTAGMLRDLGNFAAAFGRDITELVNAVLRAAQGGTERLREGFGIPIEKMGDQLRVEFRGVERTVDATAESLVGLFRELAQEEFPEAMARRMDTLDGAISNLKDTTSLLAREIGESGLNAEINDLVKTLEDAIEEGNSFADTFGESLAGGVRATNTALEVFIRHQETVILGIQALTGAAIGRGLASLVTGLRGAASAMVALNAAMASNPVGVVLTLAGAIGGPLLMNLLSAKDAAEEFGDEMDSALSSAEEGGEEELRGLIDRLEAEKEALLEQQGRFGEAQQSAFEAGGSDSRLFKNFKAENDRVREQLEVVNTRLSAARDALAEYGAESEEAGESTEKQNEATQKLIDSLREERNELKYSERSLLKMRLAKAGATDTEVERALALWEETRALEAQREAEEEAREATEERMEALEERRLQARKQQRQIEEQARQSVQSKMEQVSLAKTQQELQRTEEIARSATDAMFEFFESTVRGTKDVEDAFADMVTGILQEMARLRFQKQIAGFLTSLLGGSIPDAPTTTDFGVEPPDVPGMQHGGSFEVGGTGGVDSSMVAFRATPGEQVHVVPQGRGGGGGGPGKVEKHFHETTFAPRFLDAREADRWMRENSGRIARVVAEQSRRSSGVAAGVRGGRR